MIKKSIYILEDDPGISELLQIVVENEGYKAKIFSKVEKLEAFVRKRRPSVILMDIWIFGADSTIMAKALKNKKETASIPIVLISAKTSLDETAQQCGADAFLRKPFNIEELACLIKRFV